MKFSRMFIVCVICISVSLCGCGAQTAHEGGVSSGTVEDELLFEGYELDAYDRPHFVTQNKGKYCITEQCDILTGTEKYEWEQRLNDEVYYNILWDYYSKMDEDGALDSGEYCSFLSQCVIESVSDGYTVDEYIAHIQVSTAGTDWQDVIYNYLNLLDVNVNYDFKSNLLLARMLEYEVSVGEININSYADFEGYSAEEIAKMDYVVTVSDNGNELGPMAMCDLVIEKIAQNDGFLVFVPVSRAVDGRSGTVEFESSFCFEYDRKTQTVFPLDVHYEPSWNDNQYKMYCQYSIENIPEWMSNEEWTKIIEICYGYLEENNWLY